MFGVSRSSGSWPEKGPQPAKGGSTSSRRSRYSMTAVLQSTNVSSMVPMGMLRVADGALKVPPVFWKITNVGLVSPVRAVPPNVYQR